MLYNFLYFNASYINSLAPMKDYPRVANHSYAFNLPVSNII